MSSNLLRRTVIPLLAALAVAASAAPAGAATTLKFATLLPQTSPWGRELKKWAQGVSDDTSGDLDIEFQWNGQAGDEPLMVQKIRAGQLDGAVVSATGLAQTGVTDALIFQLPGVFTDWKQLETVKDAVSDDLEKEFEARGFVVLGWGVAGEVKTMSVGYEVHHPSDLRGKGMYVINGDPVGPALFAKIGGITPRSIAVTEVLPGLSSGTISFLTISPLLAEQLQLSSRITHVGAETTSFAIGGFLASGPRMLALSQRFKDVMKARGATLESKMDPMVRRLDQQAFERMKATKTVYDLSDAEKREWKDVFDKTAAQLRGGVFTPAIFDKVMKLAHS